MTNPQTVHHPADGTPHIPPGVAVITPNQMYTEIRATHDAVQAMRTELRHITDHESRIRSLERRMWLTSGAATILGAGLGKMITIWTGN